MESLFRFLSFSFFFFSKKNLIQKERSRTGGAGGPAENPFAGFNGRPFGAGGVNHISVEELFNMFMSQRGGMGEFQFNGQRQRMNRQRANDDDRRHYQEAAVNRPASWMSFLPILFVVLVWLGGSLFSSTPAFSLVQTHTHPVMRQTMSVERLEYFVERDFGKVWRGFFVFCFCFFVFFFSFYLLFFSVFQHLQMLSGWSGMFEQNG
jgi:hypothetical protein